MSAAFDKAFDEWATWYINNVQRIPIVDPKKQWEFLTKAMAGLIELLHVQAQDIQRLEGRGSHLFRPSGVTITGDLRRLG
jgi:hypothetical protein